MKKYFYLLLCCILVATTLTAQKIERSILNTSEVDKLFTTSLKETYKINLPIFVVYKIKYTTEAEYLVLCESQDEIKNKKDTINRNIHALLFKEVGSGLERQWEMKDNIIKSETEESCIWFWTRYMDFQDFDQDGLVDYTLVYGTKGMNGYMDGRMKILMVNTSGEKIFIRHQNGVLDDERITKIDKAFYALPTIWQRAVQKRMQLIEKEDKAIIAPEWQKQMKQKQLILKQKP